MNYESQTELGFHIESGVAQIIVELLQSRLKINLKLFKL